MSTWIVTDVGCDLPLSYIEKHPRLRVLPMGYRLDGEEKEFFPGDERLLPDFYARLRAGSMATTSQVNQETFYQAFKEITDRGDDVLCVPLSGGISGTCQSAHMARALLLEENKNARVFVEDSLCASMGEGLLLHYALQKREEGMDAEALAKWVRDNRQHIVHWFTVDDLNFLFRGGRVSRTSALMGSMLRIKPVMHVDWEGRLTVQEKVQGRKRSLRRLAEKVAELANPAQGQAVFISHGGCEEDALYVRDAIREGLPGVADFLISPIGCVIGAHSGPGTLAVFFFGDKR